MYHIHKYIHTQIRSGLFLFQNEVGASQLQVLLVHAGGHRLHDQLVDLRVVVPDVVRGRLVDALQARDVAVLLGGPDGGRRLHAEVRRFGHEPLGSRGDVRSLVRLAQQSVDPFVLVRHQLPGRLVPPGGLLVVCRLEPGSGPDLIALAYTPQKQQPLVAAVVVVVVVAISAATTHCLRSFDRASKALPSPTEWSQRFLARLFADLSSLFFNTGQDRMTVRENAMLSQAKLS